MRNDSPSSVTINKSVTSWKSMGTTCLVFSSLEKGVLLNHGTLECSLSSACKDTLVTLVGSAPKTLVLLRILSCPRRHRDDCFLLQSNDDISSNDTSLHMGTVNAMLLSLKSAMLFQDGDDSSRYFLYSPRSLHTASLTEYNPRTQPKPFPLTLTVNSKRVSIENPSMPPEETSVPTTTKEPSNQETPASSIEAVDPSELEKIYKQCLDTGIPKPQDFCQQVAVSLKDKNLDVIKKMLVTTFQLQDNDDDRGDNARLLQLQVGIRLTLLQHSKFLKLHHEVVYKSASTKKMRKKLKHTRPQQALEDQVLSFLSLLAIQCESPQEFQAVLEQVSIRAPRELVKKINNHFELVTNDEEDSREEQVSTVTPVVAKAAVTKCTSPIVQEPLPPPVKPKEVSHELSILEKSIPLTKSRSTRTNPLISNQKRKYVGSHFGTRLSNVSTLFRQVQVPVAAAPKPVKPQQQQQPPPPIQLEPRPRKRPRTIAFCTKKRVITETPAKRLAYTLEDALSPIGGSDSQNARVVAKEALAAARRKL